MGLVVTGKSVYILENSDPPFPIELLVSSLGISHREARDELNTKGGASIYPDWLKDQFSSVTANDLEV